MDLSIVLRFFFLLIQFNYTLCTDKDNKEIRSSRFDDPEIITVLPQPNWYEILSCRLDVKSSKESYSIQLYDKEKSVNQDGVFKFIGGNNNTCSFEINITRSPEKFMRDGGSFFTKELTMYEEHVCPLLKCKLLNCKCSRSYAINLTPEKWSDRIWANYISTLKIMRRANYNNKTITILTPSLKNKLKTCFFLYNKTKFLILYSFDKKIKTYDNTSTPLATPGIEHIGYDDNSCSLKLSVDFLEKNSKHIYSKNCRISAEYYRSNSESSVINYDFVMEPITWWKKNNYSRVLLPNKQYF